MGKEIGDLLIIAKDFMLIYKYQTVCNTNMELFLLRVAGDQVTTDYHFHAAHPDCVLMKHEAVPGGFNRAGEVYDEDPD